MALTLYTLPYLNSLKEEITKQVSFNLVSSKARNRYMQVMGQGYNNIKTSVDLEYINLTESEKTALETLFSVQQTNAVISYTDKVFNTPSVYKIPRKWQIAKQRLVASQGLPTTPSYVYSIKFTLESFP